MKPPIVDHCMVVPLMCCPAGLVGSFCVWAPVGASRCLPGSVALLAVLGWALLVLLLFALFCFGSFLCPYCFPSPRGLSCLVPWSSSYLGLLVPLSGYLVAAVTAQLPCFHAGSVVELFHPSVICLMATKATCPVWGFHPTPCYWRRQGA